MRPLDRLSRRGFIGTLVVSAVTGIPRARPARPEANIMTVNGTLPVTQMGNTLSHEHVLVDFIGAADVHPPRWERDSVIEHMLPRLEEAQRAGCKTFVDCTPAYLGRDVALLRILSQRTGLHFVTNTGYYGGSDPKFLPEHATTETAQQLSTRWIDEWKYGIDGTPVRPGFIKISVNGGPLSGISRKLIEAASLTHVRTGLTIASHTGAGLPAFEQLEVLKEHKVDPSAFIWVHAQSETDEALRISAARAGAWVSLDGLRDDNVNEYVSMLRTLRGENCLDRVLVSHDAGWYDPEQPGGENIRGFTTLFRKLVPALELDGFTESDIYRLLQQNPANALAVRKRIRKKKGGKS